MVPWYMKGEVGEYLIHARYLVEDGQIDDAICACLSVGMSDEEIDEFLDLLKELYNERFTGKICEIDYVGSSVRVLGKITRVAVQFCMLV